MKFKPLEWKSWENDYDRNGKLQRATAEIEIKFQNGDYKLYRTYCIHKGATQETENNWYFLILESNANDQKHEEVDSFEAGKILAEHDYQKYMNEFYKGFQKFIP